MESQAQTTDLVFYDAETDAWLTQEQAEALLEARYPNPDIQTETFEPIILPPAIPETWAERFILRRLGMVIVGTVQEIIEHAKGRVINL